MLSLKDAFLRVHTSDTGSGYDFEISGGEIESVQVSRRINRRKDDGTITIHNDDGTYSADAKQIGLGDRVDVFVSPQQAPIGWGSDGTRWGYGGWGGYLRVWSAFVTAPSYIRSSANASALHLDATDYVFGVLSNRKVFDAYEDQPIAGSDDAILNTIVDREAPEIDLSRVEDPSVTTSLVADGTNLLEVAIMLARRADCVMWGYRDKLVFKPLDSLSAEFTVDPTNDIGTFTHAYNGKSVSNVVRVDGGTDHAVDDEMTTQDGYTTVTESSRAKFQVSTRKSQLDQIEIWTNPTGSSESITVRLQKDDGGTPIEPGNSESDIDSKQLSHHFLASDGFTSFLLNDHTLPEPNPWVLIETDGSTGQEIGINTGNGTPTYKAHYPFPISVEVRDNQSIKAHSKIEQRIKQDNLNTLDAAREMALDALNHHAEPESELSFPALSQRMHRLDPGAIISFDMPRERVEGDYIITEMEDTFEGSTYHTTVKAQETSSI